MDTIRLTQFSSAAGCGCKMAPAALESILQNSRTANQYKELLVGNESSDDAAVYDWGDGTGLISTTDFFTPIVDDAFLFGKIAAANAISDVYAMGGKPLLALAILAWPLEKLGPELAKAVMAGARETCSEAGIPLAGGHSIDSTEPVFGLAVSGRVMLADMKKNNTAQAGDYLLLTKPLGVGVLSTAEKRGVIKPEHVEDFHRQLGMLNSVGYELGKIPGVHALTDVTGFGLMGHLIEMAEGSGLGAELYYSKVPILSSVPAYLSERIVPDATYRNWNAYQKKVAFGAGVNVMEAFTVLPDPQTNGGLLISVSPDALEQVLALLLSAGIHCCNEPIGKITAAGEKCIQVLA
jgi:selenide,water dikinase